ncbi:hypothetical protein JVU11DRAFT_11703 [Chiua virens]|nr:hypothetical protein JVU11DRAFT_11703 [Chiua virens]
MLKSAPAGDIFQEIYHLCFASYLMHDFSGRQEKLQKKHQECLEKLSPKSSQLGQGWELKWGPVVWKEKRDDTTGGPDLVWYVACNSSVSSFKDEAPRTTYVIAIAGTQMRSDHTWLRSNLDVTSVTEFVSWVDNKFKTISTTNVPHGKPYVAVGTARTVGRLLTEQAPRDAISGGKTLRQFLESTTESSRVIVTGHSVGAALTPTLALALGEAGIIPYDRMLTYPIAGPSPGNHIPYAPQNEDYKIWNLNLVNKFDPVPYFWSCYEVAQSPRSDPWIPFQEY